MILRESDVEHNTLEKTWESVLRDITKTLGPGCCQSWFSQVVPHSFTDGVLLMHATKRLVKDRLSSQYPEELLLFWRKYLPQVSSIEVVVANPDADCPLLPSSSGVEHEPGNANVDEQSANNETAEQCSLLDKRFTFDNFIVGKPNEFAYAAALRVADSDKPQFNPLFLYGGVGLGKTHLMHATAWKIRTNHTKRRIMYLSAEQFMYQFIRSLRFKDTMSFKAQLRSVDVLMIDDFQFIGGKETTQEEFFHTFNALVDNNKQVVISADKSPSDLENIGDRLKSRLGWGLVADIHPTTYELRLGILQSKAELLNIDIPKDVIEFLSAKITSNVRELEGALNRIVAQASLVGRAITLETTKEVLHDLIRSNEKYVTMEDIQQRTCDLFRIKMSDLLSNRRQQAFSKPRQIAMFLCKTLTTKSLLEIGRKFGGRDHTTVMHAVKKVQELYATDSEFAHDVDVLKALLTI
ncbi:MAG: chromosomal replication initiator protein DnaA [Holosporales bacterium]|nr:chromosomal replication initiator protein DnaA [Holosporales bacterium]